MDMCDQEVNFWPHNDRVSVPRCLFRELASNLDRSQAGRARCRATDNMASTAVGLRL